MKLFKGADKRKFAKHIDSFCNVTVEDEMTEDVTVVTPDEDLVEAANIMTSHKLSCLVVVDFKSKEPKGIITERDFLNKAPESLEDLRDMEVKDIMTSELVTVSPQLPLIEATDIMDDHLFRKLVVVKDGKLAGIITQTDLSRKMEEFFSSFPFRTSDSLSVKSVMKDAVTVKVSNTISESHEKMVSEKTGSLLVKNEKLEGMFTEFDFLDNLARKGGHIGRIRVGEVMSSILTAIDSEVDVFDANRLMLEKNFRRLPVFSEGKLIGKATQTTIRKSGYDIIKKCRDRLTNESLDAVNFEKIDRKTLKRNIQDKIQIYSY